MNSKDLCEVFCYDKEKVSHIQAHLNTIDIKRVSQLLKAIADENRLKIVSALCEEKELCVCDLSNILGITIANTSHHLRTLYKQQIVTYRKEGKLSFYTLKDQRVRNLMQFVSEDVKEVTQHV